MAFRSRVGDRVLYTASVLEVSDLVVRGLIYRFSGLIVRTHCPYEESSSATSTED